MGSGAPFVLRFEIVSVSLYNYIPRVKTGPLREGME